MQSCILVRKRNKGARGITTTTTQLIIIVYVTGYRNTTKMGRLSQNSILILWLSLFFLSPHTTHVFDQDGKNWQAGLVKHNNASLFRTGALTLAMLQSLSHPKKCVGPRGGVFFSADHPSLSPSSSSHTHTQFFSWPVMFGIGAQSQEHVGSNSLYARPLG